MHSAPNPAEVVASRSCRLCGEERELCDSHVVPEFIYKPLHDDRRKMLGFRRDQRGVKPKLLQKGFREPLLCAACEGHLNTHFEQPSQQAWMTLAKTAQVPSLEAKLVLTPEGNRNLILSGFDYSSFKLFLLSILWRAGVSSLAQYKQVKLGPHEGTLRRMLLDRDPGKPSDYPCLLLLTEERLRWMGPPIAAALEGHHGYRFVLGRVVLWFIVSQHCAGEEFVQDALSEQGRWVARMVGLHELPEYREMVKFAQTVDVPGYMVGR